MAFLQSAPPRQPIFRAPAVVLWLIGGSGGSSCLALWLPARRRPGHWFTNIGLYPGALQPRLPAKPHGRSRHGLGTRHSLCLLYGPAASWTHLVINCLWLLAFGPIVARRYGTPAVSAFLSGLWRGRRASPIWPSTGAARFPVMGASGRHFRPDGGGLADAARPGALGRAGRGPAGAAFVPPDSDVHGAFGPPSISLTGVTGLGMGGESALIAWQAHLGGFAGRPSALRAVRSLAPAHASARRWIADRSLTRLPTDRRA